MPCMGDSSDVNDNYWQDNDLLLVINTNGFVLIAVNDGLTPRELCNILLSEGLLLSIVPATRGRAPRLFIAHNGLSRPHFVF